MAAEITSQMTGIAGTTISLLMKILGGLFGIGIVVAIGLWKKQRNKFNIPVTIWIPRSDGKITDEVQARGGFFKTKVQGEGQVTSFRVKRKGQPAIDIPPPSARFLVGFARKLYLIQKGVDDFEPVLPDSFRYVETQNGEKVPVTDLKCINQDATAWVEDNRENAKKRFTMQGFWEKYKDFIQITIFIFIVMLSIYITYVGLQEVAASLKDVADSLSQTAGGVSVKNGG